MRMYFLSMNPTFQQNHMLFTAGTAETKIFSLETSRNRKSITISGAYRPQTKSFYWKRAEKSDSQAFKAFPQENVQKMCRIEGKNLRKHNGKQENIKRRKS